MKQSNLKFEQIQASVRFVGFFIVVSCLTLFTSPVKFLYAENSVTKVSVGAQGIVVIYKVNPSNPANVYAAEVLPFQEGAVIPDGNQTRCCLNSLTGGNGEVEFDGKRYPVEAGKNYLYNNETKTFETLSLMGARITTVEVKDEKGGNKVYVKIDNPAAKGGLLGGTLVLGKDAKVTIHLCSGLVHAEGDVKVEGNIPGGLQNPQFITEEMMKGLGGRKDTFTNPPDVPENPGPPLDAGGEAPTPLGRASDSG